MSLSRRQFLARSGATGVAVALAGSADLLFTTSAAQGAPAGEAEGYGPLLPDPRGLLDLPAGFSYTIVSVETLATTSALYGAIAAQTPDPGLFSGSRLSDGTPVPGRFDGQATFPTGRVTRIVRNHEQSTSGTKPVAAPEFFYDPSAFGGTTTVEVDGSGGHLRSYVSLAGTVNNCAGGRTPWNTWLTCEETESRAGSSGYTKDHGWVFEVDAADQDRNRDPVPLTAMGRFPHEAVAVDPDTTVAYLTEDAARPFGLLYRFTPNDRSGGYGSYRAGGLLEAMYAVGVPGDDLSTVQRVGAQYPVRWVAVPDPLATTVSTRKQFNHPAYSTPHSAPDLPPTVTPARTDAAAVTRSQKLEGAWWGDGAAYFVASYARPGDGAPGEHVGQVWRYDVRHQRIRLELVFRPGETRFDSPDNITVSPYGGGVVLAEDGEGDQYLVAVAQNGRPFGFARNRLDIADPPDQTNPEPPAEYSEFAGVTFSADGRVLFANVQTPGITYAITGPWERISPRPATY